MSPPFVFSEVVLMTGRRKSQPNAVTTRPTISEYETLLQEARLELSRPRHRAGSRVLSAPKVRVPERVAPLVRREA